MNAVRLFELRGSAYAMRVAQMVERAWEEGRRNALHNIRRERQVRDIRAKFAALRTRVIEHFEGP